VLKALLTVEGIDVNVTEGTGVTPLHVAAWYGYAQSAELLIKAVCEI